jgi:hypothetical protein
MSGNMHEVEIRLRWLLREMLKPANRKRLAAERQDELEEKLASLESRLARRKCTN